MKYHLESIYKIVFLTIEYGGIIVENQALLLRKEYFGGTLFNATSGKRIYININEFYQTKKDGIISEDLRFELEPQ